MKADTLEFYKEQYEYELKRKEEINSKVNNYITILTILGGIIVFSLKSFVNTYLAIPILIITSILFIINISIFWFSNYNKKYEYFNEASILKKEFSEIDNFFRNEGQVYVTSKTADKKLSQDEKDKQLEEFYIKFSSENKKVNDRRITWNLYFIKSVIISLVIISIIGIVAIFCEKPININIENEKIKIYEEGGIKMEDSKSKDTSKTSTQEKPQPPKIILNKPLYETFSKDQSDVEKRKNK